MTEEEWLKCSDPEEMLKLVAESRPVRGLGLLAIACCRSLRSVRGASRGPGGFDAMEYADRIIDVGDQDVEGPSEGDCLLMAAVWNNCLCVIWRSFDDRIIDAIESAKDVLELLDVVEYPRRGRRYAAYARDIANPFRPVAFDPVWRTSTAVAIAQEAYDSREFGNLPVLADALQDAGCENADVLDHLRGPGPHVRGCWVVDLVLGKA